MSVIRRRRLLKNETSIGEQIVKNSKKIQEAVDYAKGLIGKDVSIDCLIGNKNSYQNTVFLCRTLFELKEQIRLG